jgi:glycerol-3-phosphate dehydrogenase
MRAFAGEVMPSRVPRRRRVGAGQPGREARVAPGTAAEAEGAAVAPPEGATGREPEGAAVARPEGANRAPVPAPEPEPAGRGSHRPANAPHVLIVGGGAIGGALAHDLALRGLRVTLVEKGELTSGSTGRSQGLLHSGARYVITNRGLAIDCAAENKILRRIAPGSFEENDGLHVALTDEDAEFATRFLEACWQAAVPARRLTREQALRSEPGLNPDLRFAVQVPDATMDSSRLPLRFFATARSNGADIRHFTEVVDVCTAAGTVTGVRVRDRATDREYEIGADLVVNATGAWAGRVAALAGVAVAPTLSRGALVALRGRHTNMVVSRLHPPGDADVVVPEGRSTILGSLRSRADLPDQGMPEPDLADRMKRESAMLLPKIEGAIVRSRWFAVRPVATGEPNADLADSFLLIDHSRGRKPVGLITIAGGPATTMRSAAQAGADLVCARLGVERACETMDTPLLTHSAWYAR